MGYRIDIVRLKYENFHVTPLWQDARFSHGPSLNNRFESDSLTINLKKYPAILWFS